jgi:SAM-dependent methyltransferase
VSFETDSTSQRNGPAQGSEPAGVRRTPGRGRASGTRFDASYYRRFYGSAATRVYGARDIGHLARGVSGIAGWLGVDLRSVLDVGAGTGLWRDWFRRHRPGTSYRSIDVSPHACNVYGHERRDISTWRTARRFDLIVCHGVLQYLDQRAAERAIDNMGAMCRSLLYLEVLTEEDASVLDTTATDMAIHVRPAQWYRERLERHFVQVGAGLWASTRSGVRLYALEGTGGAGARAGA